MKLTVTDLPGGMRVLVRAPLESELVALAVVFHVGFAHESRERLGISHMVEHLCFSDNATRTFPAFRSAIEKIGGSFNGQTSDTTTTYVMDVLADNWRDGLRLLRDIVSQPRFTPDACRREAKVLLAETGQFRQRWLAWLYERGWFRGLWVLLKDAVWKDQMHGGKTFHRYGDLTPEMLAAWHKRYYRVDNMAVVVVGKVDPADVCEQVRQLFGAVPAGPAEPPMHPVPHAPAAETRIETRLGTPFWNQSMIGIGAWNRGLVSGESGVLDVIRAYLGNRVFDRLRVERHLAYQAGCGMDGRREGGSLLLFASVKRGDEAQSEELLRAVLAEALGSDMPEETLGALRNKLLANYARMNAMPSWYAHGLAQGAFGDYALDPDDYPAQIRAVTPARVREVMNRLLTERGRLVVRQVPLMSVPVAVGVAAVLLLALAGLVVKALV